MALPVLLVKLVLHFHPRVAFCGRVYQVFLWAGLPSTIDREILTGPSKFSAYKIYFSLTVQRQLEPSFSAELETS